VIILLNVQIYTIFLDTEKSMGLYAFGRLFQITATPSSDTTPGASLCDESGLKGLVLTLRQKTGGLSGLKYPVLALKLLSFEFRDSAESLAARLMM